jgi:hypothetical protein
MNRGTGFQPVSFLTFDPDIEPHRQDACATNYDELFAHVANFSSRRNATLRHAARKAKPEFF